VTQAALAEAEPAEELLFTTGQVARLTGATFRQLDHWHRAGHITGMPEAIGSGSHRMWTAEHIERARWLQAASDGFRRQGPGLLLDLPKLADFVRRAAEAGVFP
jgi:DNA-binding transcriptional MerR regulator